MDDERTSPDPGLPTEVCAALMAARISRRWTLREAGEHLGLSPSYLWRCENEQRTPRADMAAALCDGYDLPGYVRGPLLDAVECRHGVVGDEHEHLRPVAVLCGSSGVQTAPAMTVPRPAPAPAPPPPPWWGVPEVVEL